MSDNQAARLMTIDAARTMDGGDEARVQIALIKFWGAPAELYNLSTDLGETKNLALEMPEKAKELEATLMKRLATDQAKFPKVNPDYVPKEATKSSPK